MPDLYRNHVQFAVPDAARRHDGIGETFHAPDVAAQDDDLQAVVVIHVHMHARQRQVVMVVLHRGDTAGEVGFMMVIDIAEGGDAVAFAALIQAGGLQFLAYQVAHRLRAIGIPARVYELVKLLTELVIERYGEAFHYIDKRIVSDRGGQPQPGWLSGRTPATG